MEKNGSQTSFREMSTLYSHAFLVGEVEYRPKLRKELKEKGWKREVVKKESYSEYYAGYLKSMLEVEGEDCPDFLKSCRHYIHTIIHPIKSDKDEKLALGYIDRYKQTQVIFDYHFKFIKFHIYILPLDTVIFALEIDDSGSNINSLTFAHSMLMEWNWESFSQETQSELEKELEPLNFLCSNGLGQINNTGAKMKIFQLVEMPTANVDDALLYEIGTSSPIGCVNREGDKFRPSKSYFDMLMRENSISAFENWKALALNDSLTCLGTRGGINDYKWVYFYFPLIYLRAYFEKHFCFNRNNLYRNDNKSNNIIREMAYMEKYYFYDNISYNFLPNLIYQKVKLGLGIDLEKRELSEQIKNDEQSQENMVMGIVAVFAIISIICDGSSLLGLFGDWGPLGNPSHFKRFWGASIISFIGIIFMFWLVRRFIIKRYIFKYTKIGRLFRNIKLKITKDDRY